MTRLLTKEQARQLDHISIQDFNIPGIKLMGNAGNKIAESARELLSDIHHPSILIICGKGNNGGDGFAAALQLNDWGYQIHIHAIPDDQNIVGDSLHFYQQCEKKEIFITYGKDVPLVENQDLIIDAVFGTGIRLPIRSEYIPMIEWINQSKSIVLSADVPSGLDANTGQINPTAVNANYTVTMGHEKIGMILGDGKSLCGKIVIADIGFPEIHDTQLTGREWTLFQEDTAYTCLKPPNRNTYKHRQGKVLIIAGSKGMTGAAILSTMAAMRTGAGLTITCVPSSLNTVYEKHVLEGMTLSLDDDGKGYFSFNHFEHIKEKMDWADVVIIGPGLGAKEETEQLVLNLLEYSKIPVILDADGLRCIYTDASILSDINCPIIMTPHLGELSQLVNTDLSLVQKDPMLYAEKWMKTFSGVAVVKSVPATVFHKNKAIMNISGHSGLASAGTGDVLSGIIGSFVAQGLSLEDAAQLGVFIHGKTADSLLSKKGYRGLLASDLLDEIPNTIKGYETV